MYRCARDNFSPLPVVAIDFNYSVICYKRLKDTRANVAFQRLACRRRYGHTCHRSARCVARRKFRNYVSFRFRKKIKEVMTALSGTADRLTSDVNKKSVVYETIPTRWDRSEEINPRTRHVALHWCCVWRHQKVERGLIVFLLQDLNGLHCCGEKREATRGWLSGCRHKCQKAQVEE